MIVEAPDGRTIVSLRSFDPLEIADGGNTVFLHFVSAAHESMVVVVPMAVLRSVISALADDPIGQRDTQLQPQAA